MTGLSTGANRIIAGKFPWKNYKPAVDLARPREICLAQCCTSERQFLEIFHTISAWSNSLEPPNSAVVAS